ncbi:putative cysteine peptidase [Mycoplasma sp. 1890]
MKKISFLLGLPLVVSPILVISYTKNSNNTDEALEIKYKEKVGAYCLCDFIRLTGRQDTKIKFISGNFFNIDKYNYIVGYENGGYSIFDHGREKIVEVNPYYIFTPEMMLMFPNKDTIILRNSETSFDYTNIRDRDKPFPGDVHRPIKKTKNVTDDWKDQSKKIEKNFKNVNFSNFNIWNLNTVKNSSLTDFKKNGIRNEYNGFLYADDEIRYSWFFKSNNNKVFGINDAKYYTNEEDWGGICGYIAINQMILYNNYFLNPRYLGFQEEEKYIDKTESFDAGIIYDYDSMPWEIINGDLVYDYEYEKTHQLRTYFSNLTNNEKVKYLKENYFSPKLNDVYMKDLLEKFKFKKGTTYWNRKEIIKNLLNKKYVDYTFSYWYNRSNNIVNFIKDKKIPAFLVSDTREFKNGGYELNGESSHIYVAYGVYEDGRALVNFNWYDQWNQVIIDTNNIKWLEYLENKDQGELGKYFWDGANFVTGSEITERLKDCELIK